jgi:hypothetical protein
MSAKEDLNALIDCRLSARLILKLSPEGRKAVFLCLSSQTLRIIGYATLAYYRDFQFIVTAPIILSLVSPLTAPPCNLFGSLSDKRFSPRSTAQAIRALTESRYTVYKVPIKRYMGLDWGSQGKKSRRIAN